MNSREHSSKQYDADLEDIRSRVLQTGGLVEAQVLLAIECFATGSPEVINRVIEGEREVNLREKDIDDACVHLVARRQPAAGDLRLIMGISKIVTDLERVGDEAEKIARMARQIHGRGTLQIPRFIDVRQAGHMAMAMLRRTLDALARLDSTESQKIIAEDRVLDDEFRGIVRHLITYMMEDPRTISTAMEIMWIAKSIERIGDHSKNIAEHVIYIVHGVDVRHPGQPAADQAGGTAS